MPAGAARTATGITVSIARDPALVRTVRLVAAAVARRTSQDEDFVEEVRLAVGEACALLVGHTGGDAHLEAGNGSAPSGDVGTNGVFSPVEVRMLLEDRLRVSVVASGSIAVHDPPTSDIDGIEPWALLRGLIDDFTIARDGGSTVLSMSWALG